MANAAPILTPINIYSTGEPIGQGEQTVDTHWTLISSGGIYPANSPLYIVDTHAFPFNGAWAADYGAVARWVAPKRSYGSGQTDPAGTYNYGTTFNLSPDVDLTTAIVWGELSSDNCTSNILINGVATGFDMQALVPGSMCIKTHYYFQLGGENAVWLPTGGHPTFFARVNFLAGVNRIEFRVNNFSCPVSTCPQNPTGIIVDIHGSAYAVPEPATIGVTAAALAALALLRRRS